MFRWQNYAIAIALWALFLSTLWAQPITNPAPAGIAGAYNSSSPTCTNGQFCFIQTDVNGQLKTTGSASTALTTTQAKVTISVTNTYQLALASSATRKGCTLQYIAVAGTAGYVFFGTSPADTTTSFQLTNGQSISCNTPSGVLTDAIQVTGTATDKFIVTNQ